MVVRDNAIICDATHILLYTKELNYVKHIARLHSTQNLAFDEYGYLYVIDKYDNSDNSVISDDDDDRRDNDDDRRDEGDNTNDDDIIGEESSSVSSDDDDDDDDDDNEDDKDVGSYGGVRKVLACDLGSGGSIKEARGSSGGLQKVWVGSGGSIKEARGSSGGLQKVLASDLGSGCSIKEAIVTDHKDAGGYGSSGGSSSGSSASGRIIELIVTDDNEDDNDDKDSDGGGGIKELNVTDSSDDSDDKRNESNYCICVFSEGGKFIRSFDLEKMKDPVGICVAGQHIFITDILFNHNVAVYTATGDYVTSFGKKGKKQGQFPQSLWGMCRQRWICVAIFVTPEIKGCKFFDINFNA